MNSKLSYYIKDDKMYVQFFDAWWEVYLTMAGNCFIPVISKPSHKIIKKKKSIKDFD